MEKWIYGRNPVGEALRAGRPVERVYISATGRGGLSDIANLARSQGIPVETVAPDFLDRLVPGANHQGIVAVVADFPYAHLDDLWQRARDRGDPPFFLVLDAVQDPQNLGTLLRTAEAVGVHGVILPEHRAAGVTPAVVKASAGAVEHLVVVRVTNLTRTLIELQARGVWVFGVQQDPAAVPYDEVDLTGPLALVVGNEGRGISRLVREQCDRLIYLPMAGHVASLNAAVAGSIVLYTAWRQREKTGATAFTLGVKSAAETPGTQSLSGVFSAASMPRR